MSRRINHTATLFYHDGIQLFEARDRIGGSYVGLAVDEIESGDTAYLVIGVSPDQLQAFRLGQIDLLSLIEA